MLAARDKLTVRQLAQRVGGYGGLSFVGTPETIADQMEEWLTTEGCDGFNIMFPFLPAGLDDFVDKVVPELQRREIFRREYEGKTLRENLGLPRPKNRFFDGLIGGFRPVFAAQNLDFGLSEARLRANAGLMGRLPIPNTI